MENLERKTLTIDGESIICEFKLAAKTAVIVHGGGAATHLKKYYPVAEELVKRGIGVVLFDLSGHGESSGTLGELTLERRKRQTIGVIDALIPQDSTLYLIGFSMGAHTVCDALPVYGNRVEAILFGCPAIYRPDVQSIPFGNDTFTSLLREPDSWKTTTAPQCLAGFNGRTVIGMGDNDDVIPRGVVELLKSAAKDMTYVELHGATHKLMSWLPEHPDKLSELIDDLVRDN